MTEPKRKSKVTAPKTEVFAMRFDPKLKYMAEIAARKQRRSLANFIEWAVELGLKETKLLPGLRDTALHMSTTIWDISEPDRLVKLAFNLPELMNYDEQILWNVICETAFLWKGKKDSDGDLQWNTDDVSKLRLDRLRRKWQIIKKVATGEADRSQLSDSTTEE